MNKSPRTATDTLRLGRFRRPVVMTAVLALVISMLTGISVVTAPPAAADSPLLCDQNTVYGINSAAVTGAPAGSLVAIDVNTGATTLVRSVAPGTNALAMTPQGLDAWAMNGSTREITHYNTATGALDTYPSGDSVAPTSIIRGALNPANGIYYYAGGGTEAYVGAFNATDNTPIGQIGTITNLPSGNGDFAFSSRGLLFVVAANEVRRVDSAIVPSTPGTATLTTSLVATLPAGTTSPGITFASSGYLYVATSSSLLKLDPASGDLLATVPLTGISGFTPVDLASCTYPNTITIQKNVVARAAATDQFGLLVTGGGIESGNTATTAGTATGLQAQRAGAALAVPNNTYTYSESPRGTPSFTADRYTSGYNCVNINNGAVLSTGTGPSGTLTFPTPATPDGIDVVCTFTNTAKPSLSITAALSSSRVNPTDQFTTAIHTGSAGGPVVNATTNSTTTGTGSAVSGGTTGTYVGAADTTYYVTETASGGTNFVQYGRLISCVDSNNLQTGLPTNQPFTGSLPISVADGAQISCTIANAPAQTSITVLAGLGMSRAGATDQFTTAIHTGSATGPVVNVTANSTTTGSDSVVTPGTGTTGAYAASAGSTYYVTNAASGPGAALYTQTIRCVDANGVQPGLPDGGVFTGSQSLTPVPGAAITCTVTSTATSSLLSLAKTNPSQLVIGTPADYSFTVTNHGGTPAGLSRVLDILPVGMRFNSATGTDWSCSASGSTATGQLIDCTYSGSLDPLTTSTFVINVTPLAAAAGTSTINKASVNVLVESLPVDPTTCTATGTPAGCAVAPAIGVPVVDAVNDTGTTAPGVAIISTVLANDTVSPVGTSLNPASVTVTATPSHGTTTVNTGNGRIKYQPNAEFSGVDAYTYSVCDTSSPVPVCDTATVTITVPNVVTAGDDTVSTPQNTLVNTAVLNNDTVSVNGAPIDPATLTITDEPDHGTAVLNESGSVSYTPTGGYSGPDSYSYQVCDRSIPTPVCDTAVVSITVGGNTVVAGDDNDTTAPATAVIIDVRSNDSSSTGQALAIPTITSQPGFGAVSVDPGTGFITYTPTAGRSGVDSYGYQVCDTSSPTAVCDTAVVTITVPNVVAATGDAVTTGQNLPVTTNVLANDTITPGGAPLNPASVAVSTTAGHGTTSVNPVTGAITYTPTAGYSGPDSYTYTVCDGSTPTPICASGTVTVTVGSNVVVATDDSANTAPGTPVTTNVRVNDTSSTGQSLADPTVTTVPAHGVNSVDSTTGDITYTPNNGFSGVDSYGYSVCDTSSPTPICGSATVTITVPNTVTAIDDTASTPQNTPITTAVLSNDTISDNAAPLNPTSVTVTIDPDHGTAVVTPVTGTITYTPNSGYSGPDSYRYTVCDSSTPTPVCADATVTVTVGANTVSANPDSAETPPGTPVSTDVRANDSSSTGQPLADPTVTTEPGHGTATVDSVTGQISYTPDAGFSGTDRYGYTVCDTSTPSPVCGSATVTISVPNQVVAGDDNAVTPQNTAVTTAVLLNDTISANGSPLNPASVAVTTPAGHGATVVDPATGAIAYTPAAGYSGPDSYSYRVCDSSTPTPVCDTATVTVTVGSNTVVATSDNVSVAPGASTTVDVLANDSSSTGQPLAAPTVTVQPGHGTTAVDPVTGAITYAPNNGFSGADTFSYQVCDTSNPTPVCISALVTVTVPTVVTALNDSGATPQNTAVVISVLGNDTVTANAAALNPASVATTDPAHGSTTINTERGAVTYTPDPDYSGVDTFQYSVCDGSSPVAVCTGATVTITVAANVVVAGDDAVQTTPATAVAVAVLTNDITPPTGAALDPASLTVTSGPGHGTTAVADGVVTYTPAAGFSGVDTFTYQVCDSSNPIPVCDSAVVSVTVPNSVVATDDSDTTPQNTQVRTAVLANDSVTAGGSALDPASVVVTSLAAHGVTVVDPSTGDVLYTPAADYSGTDIYTYQVCDSSAPTPVCASATVTITVPTNTITARNDTATTLPVTPVTTAVLQNDTVTTNGAALNPATVTVTIAPAHGATQVNSTTGTIAYTPAEGFSGADAYTYQVCDFSEPESLCATATVTVTVATVVLALDDVAAVEQNTIVNPAAVTTPVLDNDTVTPGAAPLNPASVTLTTQPTHGTAVVVTEPPVQPTDPAIGEIRYTPNVGYTGPDEYTYRVCDTSSPTPVCVTATVTIAVGTNVVAANADVAVTTPAVPVAIDVRSNDSTSTGQPLALPTISAAPAHGTATVDPESGVVTYTPNPGFSGADTFEYTVCDTSNPTPVCASASVIVAVDGPLDVNDDSAAAPQNTPVDIDVLSNDSVLPNSSPLNPASVTTSVPEHGTTVVDPETGAVTYAPAVNYAGPDSFTYTVCDTAIPTPVCATATVSIVVQPNVVTAVDDTVQAVQGAELSIDVLDNDSVLPAGAELDPASVTVLTGPEHGGTAVDPTTGVITYTPADGYSGPDSFSYQVCDESVPTPVCGSATVNLTVLRTGLTFVKTGTVDDTNVDGVTSIGDTINYSFTITNTGEVVGTGLGVVDVTIGNVTCPATELAPGASMECTADNGHVITEADAAAGGVSNSAYAVGAAVCPGSTGGDCVVDIDVLSDVKTVLTPVSTDAQLVVAKTGSWTDVDDNGSASVGDLISWSITVSNPGTAAVSELTVSDPTAGAVTCPVTSLAPGALVTCTVPDHSVTAADVAAGSIGNTASATGVGPTGDVVSLPVTATVTLPTPPTPNNLSYTGFDVAQFLRLGLLLALGGATLLLIGRRRRKDTLLMG